jgi:ribosome-interacting GTPase 1
VKTHHSKENHVRRLKVRFARLRTEAADAGMSTAEYAVGTIAAVGFAGVLFKVVTSSKVQAALSGLIEKALH